MLLTRQNYGQLLSDSRIYKIAHIYEVFFTESIDFYFNITQF